MGVSGFIQIWQKIECNANFKQWFNVFLVITEAWQGYELKAYGVLNHNLKLQCKKLSRTRDIPNFPTQGWAGTAFCTRKRSETYINQGIRVQIRISGKILHSAEIRVGIRIQIRVRQLFSRCLWILKTG